VIIMVDSAEGGHMGGHIGTGDKPLRKEARFEVHQADVTPKRNVTHNVTAVTHVAPLVTHATDLPGDRPRSGADLIHC
jgi:hypothetical protein